MVYFGTGKYLDAKDREFSSTTRERQTFYAIWDRFEGDSITRSNLQQQKILTDVVYFNVSGTLTPFDLRVTSDTGTSGKDYWYGTSEDPENPDVYGWYLDLYNTFNSNEYTYGERQITDSIILNGKIIFTTTIPDVEICNVNSSGWLMELDAETGNPLKDSVFDANNDGLIDYKDALYSSVERGDLSTPEVPLSGKKSTVGILSAPGILSDFSNSNAAKEFKYMSGSSGKIQAIRENPDAAGQAGYGRKSWRQLFR